jgi:hypothetical protein
VTANPGESCLQQEKHEPPCGRKKEEKEKGYQLSNRQAAEDAIKDIGRLFVP